jgi:uncharacterized protein YqeY
MRTVADWKSILRERLKESMRAKDARLVAMYRETLAALDNAEAPAASKGPAVTSGAIAGALVGLGAGEAPRIALTPDDVQSIIERELRERREGAATYEAHGRAEDAAALRRQADVLQSLLE